jgi:hypothetical protein
MMERPTMTEHDALTGETVAREMTEQEYEVLLASGWTLDGDTPPEGGQ